IRRVRSMGIDQFDSVAAAVAGVAWAQLLWHQVTVSIATETLLVRWVPIVALIASIALIAVTVFAPLIPRLREDFEGRMETLAHRNADPVRPVIHRPRSTPAAAAVAPVQESDDSDDAGPAAGSASTASSASVADEPDGSDGSDQPADADATRVIEVGPVPGTPHAEARQEGTSYTDPIGALHEIFESNGAAVPGRAQDHTDEDSDADDTTHSRGETEALLRRNRGDLARAADSDAQPFWILAGTERDVLDERGQPLYRIGPSAWTLVIEDRDGAYVVRHDD